MRRGIGSTGIGSVSAVVALWLALAPAAGGAGGQVKPRNGSYSGIGIEQTQPSLSVELPFQLKAATIDFDAGILNIPGCNGGMVLTDAPLGDGSFDTTYNGANSETNRIKGRWVSDTTVRGKVILGRPNAASCGDPGAYIYKFSARRYGKP